MLQVFMQGGILMWPLVLIVMVLIGLVLRTGWELAYRGGNNTALIQNGLDGLLFWGGFAVILGVLGTVTGYHKAMSAVIAYGIVNPRAVWIGLAEGLVSSIAGLLVLAGAGLCWFGLRWWHLRDRQAAK